MNRKRVTQILLLIVLLGTSIRLVRTYLVNWIERDPVAYIKMSEYIAEGKIKDAIAIRPEVPPLFIILMAALEKAGLSAEHAGILISLTSGILVILSIFLITSLIFDDRTALLAAFIASLQTELVNSSTFILRESLALALLLFSLYFAMSALKKHTLWKWGLSGAAAALCSLTRPDGMEVLLAIPIWILVSLIFYKPERKKIVANYITGFILFMLFFTAIAYPVQGYFKLYGSTYTPFFNREMLRIYLGLNI